MNREGKKCVLYPRVSTEMQVDGYSLEGQKNGLKRFADREEMEIVGIYEDAGKSGKSIEGRPAFKKMLSDIGNGLEIDYILVYKLSRFGRNAADILNSLEYVQSYGVNLICIEEGIDSSQTSGKLLISVLSAVAEIERENIIEQTMNGRREKARQGGWNGGFAPYGYYLKDNQLLIEESEAAAIRIIFEKFAGSDIGYGGIAKYLNLQGIKKIPRQNGTLENWSGHLVRQILDNPVYCGKIAYGRRTREKVKGTKNEYKQVHAEDYILEDGQHEGIVSEELWQKVHAKRVATGIKQPSKTGKDRSHLLTGVLKCPLCGSPMYTNKHAWTNKDGTYKEVYYYICGRNKQERGHYCEYKASLRKTDIEPLVIEAIRELVSDKSFAKEIKKRFGVQTDTSKIDKELANYESKLKEVDLNKARLEREIDNLPADAKYRERKIHDMTIRLDGLYDTIVELEERIEDAKLRRSSIEMEAITLENVYRIMENFSKLYAIISDEEKKSLVSYLIKEIQIYPNGTSDRILKSIEFNFPIYRDGREIRKLLWENGNTVDTYTVDGKSYTVPTVNVYNTSDVKRFDLDTIKKVATYIFGPDIKLSNPNKDSMVTWFYSYLVTLDNQSNDNFKSFVFSQESGFVSDLRNFGDDSYGSRLLYIAADLEHYLITVYDKDTKIMNLEYYDKDLKKLWSREFEDVTDFPMDYTSDEIMLVADNDLYVINTKDGKDKIEPTFVGEKVRVIMADDGAILISKTKKDLVTKVDKKGKIVWSIDAKYSILNNSDDAYYDSANNNINGLQVINGNYVLSYNGDDGSQKDENEYNFGVGTCYLVFDKDGNIILEELEEKKTDNGNDEEAYTENYDDYDEENY